MFTCSHRLPLYEVRNGCTIRLLKAALPALHVSSISVWRNIWLCVFLMGSLFVLNLAHEQREGGAADISPRAFRASQKKVLIKDLAASHDYYTTVNCYIII